eukprot:NODE_679_length_5285_cov_0.261088.p1 type:complete len:892 gc:universal NODE_679_length_5285_cov_0.261088:1270-3945(+)
MTLYRLFKNKPLFKMDEICKIAGNYYLADTHYAFRHKHGSENQLINVKTKDILPINQYGCILVETGEYIIDIPKEDEKRGLLGLFKVRKRSTSQTNPASQISSFSSGGSNSGSLNNLLTPNPNNSVRRRSAGGKKEEKGTTRLADLEALIESDNSKSGELLPLKRNNSAHSSFMKESLTQELGLNIPTNLFSKRILNERKEKVNSKLMMKMLHPPIAQGHVKSALNPIVVQTLVSYFVELKDYELCLYTNLTRQKLVKKLQLTKNSLAVIETNQKDVNSFDLMLDAQMITMTADCHDDMIKWAASINTAANTLFLISVLNDQQTREMVRDLLQSGARDKKSSDYVSDIACIIKELKSYDYNGLDIRHYEVPELKSDEIQKLMSLSDVLRKDSLDVLPDDTPSTGTSRRTSGKPDMSVPVTAATLTRRKSKLVRGVDPISEGINNIPTTVNPQASSSSLTKDPVPLVPHGNENGKVSDSTLTDPEKNSNSQLEVNGKFSLNSEDAWLTSPVEASNIQDEIIKMTGMEVKRTNSDIQVIVEGANPSAVSIRYGVDDNNKRSRYSIIAAHLDKYVERLSDEFGTPDEIFADSFILGCRHFSTVAKGLEKLMKRFNAGLPADVTEADKIYFKKWRTSIRSKIISFLMRWIREYAFDFRNNENRDILERFFIMFELCDFSEIEDVLLEQQLHDSFCEIAALLRYLLQLKLQPLPPSKPKPVITKRREFSDFEAAEIAQQICIIEFEKFSKIRSYELLLQLWGDLKDHCISAELLNYGEMIQQFNQLSYWVATEIATQPEIKPRIKLIEKYIKIAKELEKLRNYNGLVAIVSGLNLAAVSRLKVTWEGVSEKSKEVLQELETVCSPQSNYKNYRQIFDKIDRDYDDSPFIPFLGYLS